MGLFNIIDDIAEKQILKTETGDNRIFGVLIGKVVSNYDKDMPGRVCVSVYTRDAEANELKWARVAMPSSGEQWGHYFLPEVGDQVLLTFEEGNIEKPYVIGCIPKDNNNFLKKSVDEKNQFKRIITKNGNMIQFEDNEEGDGTNDKISIITSDSTHRIELNNEKGFILIADKDGANQIEMKTGEKGEIEITAAKKLVIKVGDSIELIMNSDNGTTSLKTKKLRIEASENMDYSANGNANFSGNNVSVKTNASLKMESSGGVTISGTPIKIG